MEVKKSERANLEKKRLLFVEVGLILSLAIVYGAFSFSTKEKAASVLDAGPQETIEEEIIPITQETPPPPPETPKIPVLSEQIDIVDDDIKVDEVIINTEDEADLGVEIMDYVEGAEEEEIEEEAIPFMLVEQKPSFQGGDANAFSKWVNSRLNYPDVAKENGVQGRVMLQFTVGADGVVRDVKVLRGVDPSLDKEAIRVVKGMPKWIPGEIDGEAVTVRYTLPVTFRLN